MSMALSARVLPNGGRFDCQPGQSSREAAQVAGYWPDLCDLSSVEEWQQRFPGVRIVPVLSAEAGRLAVATEIGPACGVGRPPADGDVEVFDCGNPLMIKAARRDFVAAGLAPDRFHCDAFITHSTHTN